MEKTLKDIRKNARDFYERIEHVTNLHLSPAEKFELLEHLRKSYHGNDMSAIYFDAYLHLQEMGHQSRALEEMIEAKKKKAFALSESSVRNRYLMRGNTNSEEDYPSLTAVP